MSDNLPVYRPNDPYEVSGIQAGFQLPRWVWGSMFASYGIFFVGIAAATGRDAATLLMLGISLFYMLMFFGTAAVLNRQKGGEHVSPLDRAGGMLDTWTGPMDGRTVAAQILAVPAGFAFLGVTFFVIRAGAGF
ncbi:MAG TPA: hypothetical protein PKD99_16490 [Sphingopyxis sp.]|nr:hypothetical protein [Sphingopyxis sp.]HMP46700.1 hypothetical protein [Sphingopyxis sp.]HMQ19424.1 hypothetical protein [Sphingopyxis sp.]